MSVSTPSSSSDEKKPETEIDLDSVVAEFDPLLANEEKPMMFRGNTYSRYGNEGYLASPADASSEVTHDERNSSNVKQDSNVSPDEENEPPSSPRP